MKLKKLTVNQNTTKFLHDIKEAAMKQVEDIQKVADQKKQSINQQYVGHLNSVLSALIYEKELDVQKSWSFNEDFTEIVEAKNA
jgi:hypothetical protein